MIEPILIFLFFALFIMSIIDIFTSQRIPSILTTGILIVCAILGIANLSVAVVGLLIAYGILESELGKGGIADLKLLTAVSFSMPTITALLTFVALVVGLGILYKILIALFTDKDEVPFIPVIFIAFIINFIVTLF